MDIHFFHYERVECRKVIGNGVILDLTNQF
jgi:hypothetical protein